MVVVPVIVEDKSKGMYMDGQLYKQLTKNVIPKVHNKDFDYLLAIDGMEGAGKSVFAQQIAKILDPTFTLKQIAFTPNDFVKIVVNSEKYKCVVFDEAFTGLSSRSSLSEVNQLLVSLMMEMRQRNLFVIIVLPTFFMLDKYVALHRSRCLFHVTMNKQGKRGFWKLYNKNQMKYLYFIGKKYYDYKSVKWNIEGRFPNFYTVNEPEYRKKKSNAIRLKDFKGKANKYKEQRDALIYVLYLIWAARVISS